MVNRSNDLREHNRKVIMKEILSHRQISRQKIIERTGLAPSTVSLFPIILTKKIGSKLFFAKN